ncbi:TlpA family protein disulfide reductase [Autumnicola musiva]|uniref:Thioredoxin family protein n=1 Tax=Autumnicola musiva TaxID=3075589 RepID=A0ABU3D8I0_9FLAO|nr:thioredoxin family protein [Zunongwangia sp. F117]MDT0677814.1 thioredoxin family protein [Zunongwangia sp. F117]
MNKFLSLFLLVFLSCGSAGTVHSKGETSSSTVKKRKQQGALLGEINRNELEKEPYVSWFDQVYEEYDPNQAALGTITKNISDYNIKVFFGTWCPDSRRELPKFVKILDRAGYDFDDLTLIAVDRSKTTPGNLEEGLNVKRVPTMIFYKDGQEVNRFVEYSQESLEEDIAKIVSEKEYRNPYAE